ncbi:hypothetical protein DACRYDRAFT_22856 [Dacryopinax primogenitus]|uniref:Uncharacterized protein n=1 Tax=Dacryopinax primogenitus (strain DJM 731) TaxID=1858805 RepID=M5FX82_DACPD|nr:uncharacterized protein DACRYDRAFT_22856 [Dacryopinax primogenitus]EJU01049.1 hypothetical protein DACRYDRAFT_22856 [Dacryopinax primogenitus]
MKAEKGKAKAKETTLAKSVMPRLDDGMDETPPVIRVHGRPMKEDSRNVGWIPEETLVKVLLATTDAAVLESFAAENCMSRPHFSCSS